MLGATRGRLLAAISSVALLLAGCGADAQAGQSTGNLAGCSRQPDTCNSAPVKKGGSITYAIDSTITNWNLRSPAGTAEADYAVLSGILPFAFVLQPDGINSTLDTDLLESAQQVSASPQTIVYQLNPHAVWSDGTPITAADFIYNWHVADGVHCPACQTVTAGYDQIKSITGSDGGRTVTVVFSQPFTDWRMLFSPLLPASVAARYGSLSTPAGLAQGFNNGFVNQAPTWSAGPMMITSATSSVIIEKPNPKWWGKKPSLDSVVFRVLTDDSQLPTALQNGEVDTASITATPDLAAELEGLQGFGTHVSPGATLAKIVLNLGDKVMTKPLRLAILTAINRQQIRSKVLGSLGASLPLTDSLNLLPGTQGYQDNLTATGEGSGNIAKAKALLTAAGYRVQSGHLLAPDGTPVKALQFVYSTGDDEGELISQLVTTYLAPLGLTVNSVASPNLDALVNGDFDMIYFNSGIPGFPFYGAQVFYTTTGVGNFGHYSNSQVDQLINAAASATSMSTALSLLNQADKLEIADAPVLPLYTLPSFTVIRCTYANIQPSSAAYLTYNVQDWGLRAGQAGC